MNTQEKMNSAAKNRGWRNAQRFCVYLRVLIEDLKKSGNQATAVDVQTAYHIIAAAWKEEEE